MSSPVGLPPPNPPTAATLATHLGNVLYRLQRGGSGDVLRATITLLCQERDQGNVCVLLSEWQRRALPGHAPFPALDAWRQELLATGLCDDGTGASAAPLVLRADHRLYLLRHHRVEQQIVAFVRAALAAPPLASAEAIRHSLDELGWLPATPAAPDWQLAAVVTAAHRRFVVLSGGPGTGKTTTVAKVITLLRHREPGLRIALCAPTGKAAARLGEALRAQLPADAGETAAPRPTTLHRLLGYLPTEDAFRSGPDRTLPYDMVVVDEASMVDPAMLAVLFSALRPDARLLLVGDKDQLAAIAAGQVLGELSRSAAPEHGTGPHLAAFVAAATGMQLPVATNAHPMADATIALRKNHRFGQRPGIGGFAMALANRAPTAALAALAGGHADLRPVQDPEAALAAIADAVAAAARAASPEAALQHLATVRILCATKHGPHGTEAWNRRVEALLRERGHRIDGPLYAGRPILVQANDHQNQIWNGDLGVLHHDAFGRLVAWFARPDEPPRAIPPSRLPPHETAWAMTVHKSQGSEFDLVLVSMPDRPGPLWQASLVYTAVTRARQRAIVLADPELLRQAVGNWPERASGLAAGLQ